MRFVRFIGGMLHMLGDEKFTYRITLENAQSVNGESIKEIDSSDYQLHLQLKGEDVSLFLYIV